MSAAADLRVLAVDRGHSKSNACLLARLGPDGVQQICRVANAGQHYVLVAAVDTHRDDERYVHQVTIVPNLDDLIGRLLELIGDMEQLATPEPLSIGIAYALEPAERERIDQTLDERAAINLGRAAVQGSA
jgi:hypothetical protein